MTLENPTVGRDLATLVVDTLDRKKYLIYAHRDYCGMGLAKDGEFYVYDAVYDGFPPCAKAKSMGSSGERIVFDSREEFIAWLSEHTDDSLSGDNLPGSFYRGNQRLTITRLREFCAQ